MHKIIAGFLGLVMVAAVVGGTAYALFSSTATASGVTFATGNADLRIYDGDSWEATYPTSNIVFTGLFPGYGYSSHDSQYTTRFVPVYLKNVSTSPVSLEITMKLQNGATETPAGAWDVLKDQVYVAFEYDTTGGGTWSGVGTYYTLNQWNSGAILLPGSALPQDTQRNYRLWVSVNTAAGNEIATQSLSAMTFEFTGTQAVPSP